MNCFFKMLKGYMVAFFLFFILSITFAFLIKFTSLPEGNAQMYLIGAICLACVFLGVFSGKLIGKRGLLLAAAFSSIFVFLVIFAISCAYFREISLKSFDWLFAIPIVAGGVGGIIGVNVKK